VENEWKTDSVGPTNKFSQGKLIEWASLLVFSNNFPSQTGPEYMYLCRYLKVESMDKEIIRVGCKKNYSLEQKFEILENGIILMRK